MMSTTSDVEKMNKLLQFCPNSNIPSLGSVVKTPKHANLPKPVQRQATKGLMQKFKSFTFKAKSQTLIKTKATKKLTGCNCKVSERNNEYCTTIMNILDRIEKQETRLQIREMLLANNKVGNVLTTSEVWGSVINSSANNTNNAQQQFFCTQGDREQKSNSDQLFLAQGGKETKNWNKDKEDIDPQTDSCNSVEHQLPDFTVSPIHGAFASHKPKPDKGRPYNSATKQHAPNENENENQDNSNEDGFKLILKRSTCSPIATTDDIVGMIDKDLKRTFQNHGYFKVEDVQFHLRLVLHQIGLQHESIGYVQGMNFIAGCIVYHCNNFVDSSKIMSFLIDNLQLEHVYSFVHLYRYVDVLKKLLEAHVPDFYAFTQNVIGLDFSIHLIDWFFCLGLNKIPLEHSQCFLEQLVLYGWYFFYRVLIMYFKLFEDRHAKIVKMTSLSDNKKIDIEVMIKNFYKEKHIDWASLIKKASASVISDKVIKEELVWDRRDRFARPGYRVN